MTEIERLRAALEKARIELLEAADKFWVFHCNAAPRSPQGAEDKAMMETLSLRMSASAREALAALAPAAEGGGRKGLPWSAEDVRAIFRDSFHPRWRSRREG